MRRIPYELAVSFLQVVNRMSPISSDIPAMLSFFNAVAVEQFDPFSWQEALNFFTALLDNRPDLFERVTDTLGFTGSEYNRGTGCRKTARPGLCGGGGIPALEDRLAPSCQRRSSRLTFEITATPRPINDLEKY